MHRRAVGRIRLLGVDDERQRLVLDVDEFGGVLGERAGVGDDGGDPFARIARLPDRQRIALDVGRIEPVHHRIDGGGEFLARQHIAHAGHRERGAGVDR